VLLPWVLFSEAIQGLTHGEKLSRPLLRNGNSLAESESLKPASMLACVMASTVINQYPPHCLRHSADNMPAIFPPKGLALKQSQVSLVYQFSRLQCVVGTLPAHVGSRDPPQVIVDGLEKVR
jgi:hypothetical protein